MKNRSTILYGTGFATPETLFTIRPDAEPGLHIDALHCNAHARRGRNRRWRPP
jgi:hypothetical protein